jgi:hypothetical protein
MAASPGQRHLVVALGSFSVVGKGAFPARATLIPAGSAFDGSSRDTLSVRIVKDDSPKRVKLRHPESNRESRPYESQPGAVHYRSQGGRIRTCDPELPKLVGTTKLPYTLMSLSSLQTVPQNEKPRLRLVPKTGLLLATTRLRLRCPEPLL